MAWRYRLAGCCTPSPASPAANRGWAAQAGQQLVEQGVWERGHWPEGLCPATGDGLTLPGRTTGWEETVAGDFRFMARCVATVSMHPGADLFGFGQSAGVAAVGGDE